MKINALVENELLALRERLYARDAEIKDAQNDIEKLCFEFRSQLAAKDAEIALLRSDFECAISACDKELGVLRTKNNFLEDKTVRLRKALQPFAEYAGVLPSNVTDVCPVSMTQSAYDAVICVGDLRRARAVLAGEDGK